MSSFFRNLRQGHRRSQLAGDAFGGLTAAIIALPMGIAFGVQSNLGAEAGLYTAIILAFVAALIGGTQTLISDPTGPMTVVSATIIAAAMQDYGDRALSLIVATFLLAAILQLAFSFLRVARYVKYIPYPVISGFMGGIGIIIIIFQLYPLLGQTSPKVLWEVLQGIGSAPVNSTALLLGLATIAIIFIFPLLTKKIPSILVALVLGSLATWAFGLQVPTIGEIPTGLPAFQLHYLGALEWMDLNVILVPAATLAALGTIDTLLTSVVADTLTETRHDGDRELIGQGLGNFLAVAFGGIPGAGATMGTVTNIKAGGNSHLSGMFKGLFLLLIILVFAPLVAYIPTAVLAGILITIGLGIIDYKGIRLLVKMPRHDAGILVLVLLITVFNNLLNAVAVGSILSALLFMKKMADAMSVIPNRPEAKEAAQEVALPQKVATQVHVETLNGPLFFGFSEQFMSHIQAIEDQSVRIVVLDLHNVPFIDGSGLLTLENAVLQLRKQGVEVYLTASNSYVEHCMRKIGLIPRLVPETHFTRSLVACMERLKTYPLLEQAKQALPKK